MSKTTPSKPEKVRKFLMGWGGLVSLALTIVLGIVAVVSLLLPNSLPFSVETVVTPFSIPWKSSSNVADFALQDVKTHIRIVITNNAVPEIKEITVKGNENLIWNVNYSDKNNPPIQEDFKSNSVKLLPLTFNEKAVLTAWTLKDSKDIEKLSMIYTYTVDDKQNVKIIPLSKTKTDIRVLLVQIGFYFGLAIFIVFTMIRNKMFEDKINKVEVSVKETMDNILALNEKHMTDIVSDNKQHMNSILTDNKKYLDELTIETKASLQTSESKRRSLPEPKSMTYKPDRD